MARRLIRRKCRRLRRLLAQTCRPTKSDHRRVSVCVDHQGTVPGPVYPHHTAFNERCYFFYDKHHLPSNVGDAQWLPRLLPAEEFGVFELANQHDLSDDGRNLFGLRIREGLVLELGMFGEQVAKFPFVSGNKPWHGFPHWPLATDGGAAGRIYPPPRQALKKMEAVGLITSKQRRRIESGKHV